MESRTTVWDVIDTALSSKLNLIPSYIRQTATQEQYPRNGTTNTATARHISQPERQIRSYPLPVTQRKYSSHMWEHIFRNVDLCIQLNNVFTGI